ncbi:hypothetical protein Nepgr_030473 [Nepenthes gracilis]|uniref:Cytochrome P450 n=1 Tax=Nepenthes gracilis TaxID=150966 RepID=A0AAD3TFE2_NEPGR|nr:hypothetical protein Nepgr_030473 [Nepenthes gracilis]
MGVIILAGAGILAAAWRLFDWVWRRPKSLERALRRQGLSGNPYRLLFGDIRDYSKMLTEAKSKPIPFTNDYFSRVRPFHHQTINNYGKSSFIWLGPMPMVQVTEPELMREVLNKFNDYQKPKTNPLFALAVPGLVQYEGDKWSKHRKLINPAFHMEKLKVMLPAFHASCDEMITKLEEMVPRTGSHELDVWPYLATLTADVISRAAFGSNYEDGRRIFELLREQTSLIVQYSTSVYVPGWRYLPTKTNRRLSTINIEIQTMIRGLINKRKQEMEAGEGHNDDLLGLLIESSVDIIQKNGISMNFDKMTVNEVIDECKLFYFAGQETTSVLLVWTMIMLGKHQDWQEQAREEVLRTFGNKSPDFDGLNHLKTVTMILYEVLRLYPPVVELRRRVYNNINLGKLSLPAGALVSLPIILAHYDHQFWGEDAEEFKPERFSEGISKATKGNVSFFPFSWGPRICIGQNFALVEAKFALAMILQRFCFELSSSYTHAPSTSPILQPQYGAHIVLRRL